MFVRNLRSSWFRSALVAGIALALCSTLTRTTRADTQSKTTNFELTGGDFKLISFVPGAAGAIKIEADFNSLGKNTPDTAIRMQLLQPDGKVAKEVVGGSPLVINFALSAAQFQKFKGKAWQIRLSDDVAQKNTESVKGAVSLTFPIATQTVLNTVVDVAGEGAEQDTVFQLPKKQGRLDLTVTLPAKLPRLSPRVAVKLNLKPADLVTVQLLRGDGKVVATKTVAQGQVDLTHEVSADDLTKGTTWRVRLINNGDDIISGIREVAKFTPK
jgi:hypothetical protein